MDDPDDDGAADTADGAGPAGDADAATDDGAADGAAADGAAATDVADEDEPEFPVAVVLFRPQALNDAASRAVAARAPMTLLTFMGGLLSVGVATTRCGDDEVGDYELVNTVWWPADATASVRQTDPFGKPKSISEDCFISAENPGAVGTR